jgi:tetratricopeptide (TPR) repeat protein
MITNIRFAISTGLFACLLAGAAGAQTTATQPAKTPDRATAYYHFSMGHLYAELAGMYGNRGDYASQAIDHYKKAIAADPSAAFLSEELSDLYIQAGRINEAVTEAEAALKQNPNDVVTRRILARLYTRMIGDSRQNSLNETMLKKAIEQYRRISELDRKDVDSLLMLGRLEKAAQNSVESEKAYKRALEIEPDNEDALTGLAMVYADVGDTKSAAVLLKKVTDKNPSLRTLMALAGAYEQLRDYASAAETLLRTLEIAPKNADVKRALAQNLLLADKLDESLKLYEELAQEDPKDWSSALRISQIYRQKHQFDKAREAARKARELEPDNLEIRYSEVSLLEAEGKIAEAIAEMKSIVSSTAKRNYSAAERGNRAALLERLGHLYRSDDQYAEAVATYRQISELDPELGARVAAQVIETWRAARDFKKAEQEADTAAQKFPNDRMLTLVRASLLADIGKGEQGASLVRGLIDGKNDWETWLSLAQIYEKSRNYPEMAKAVDAAEKLSQSDEERERIHFTRGAMFEKMKKFDAAEAEFRKVIELNPKNHSAMNYLGYMMADRNVRLPEAHKLITEALKQDADNGAYLDSLGWVLFRMNKLQDAEKYLRMAIEKVRRDPTVHDHLGDVYARLGRLKDAITQWQISLKAWESSPQSESDSVEIAKIQRKLEGAKVRVAKEGTAQGARQH